MCAVFRRLNFCVIRARKIESKSKLSFYFLTHVNTPPYRAHVNGKSYRRKAIVASVVPDFPSFSLVDAISALFLGVDYESDAEVVGTGGDIRGVESAANIQQDAGSQRRTEPHRQ